MTEYLTNLILLLLCVCLSLRTNSVVAISAFEQIVGRDDNDEGDGPGALPAVPVEASTEDRITALEATEVGATRAQFRELCMMVDAHIWYNTEYETSKCKKTKGVVARFFASPWGILAVNIAIVASLLQVYLDATTERGSAGFYICTIIGVFLLAVFVAEAILKVNANFILYFYLLT